MAATYDCIATTTLNTAETSVTFSSISGNYTDIVLVIDGAPISGGTSMDSNWRVNGDTGSNYSDTRWQNASTDRSTSATFARFGAPRSSGRYTQILQFMNYSNTTTYKTGVARSGNNEVVEAYVGLWRNTSAITSITVVSGQGRNYTSGTIFTLYGIKAA